MLVPVFVCVVLPVSIVAIVFAAAINNDNKRSKVLINEFSEDYVAVPLVFGSASIAISFAYQDLNEALNRIPAKERTSVLLFYMQGYSIKEIAEIQESSQDAVKQHLSRGRNHLRGLLSTN